MKAGWEYRKLGEVCDVIGGGTPAKDNDLFYLKGTIPWATVRDMKSDVISNTEFKITAEAVKGSSTNIIPKGSIVIATRVGLGKVCLLAQDTAINQDLKGVIPKNPGKLMVSYLFQWFKNSTQIIIDEGTGATVQGVKLPFIKSLIIPIPPIKEQQRIVGILDKAFESIATAKANAEKNLQNARALFESHLQAVFSQRGEGWVEKRLEEVARIINGYAFKSTDFTPIEGAKSIKITNVGVREFVCESDNYLPADFTAKYPAFSVKTGSIVIALTRTIISGGLKVAIIPDEYDGALLNQRVASIQPNQKLMTEPFLFAYLSTQSVVDYVTQRVNTLMQPNLSITDLRVMPIPAPPVHEQMRIADEISALRDETQRLESIYQQKLAALDELKKSLLDQAFRGEL
ncbi:MAG: restriction endonuclease subunit S [Geobacter sp.]|nr:restriction endonuclease subunit S [Geobacter sp.]